MTFAECKRIGDCAFVEYERARDATRLELRTKYEAEFQAREDVLWAEYVATCDAAIAERDRTNEDPK